MDQLHTVSEIKKISRSGASRWGALESVVEICESDDFDSLDSRYRRIRSIVRDPDH